MVHAGGDSNTGWTIALISFDLTHPVIGIRLWDDALVGRSGKNICPDLDLTHFEAHGYGVSREQAELGPGKRGVEVIDLNSSNGTYVNRVRLAAHQPHRLKNDDLLSFGRLEFRVKVAQSMH